mgnify:CR=1 FL=1
MMDALTLEDRKELDRLLAGFGDWICEQCKTGEHARCAGWGGTRGDHCLMQL